jgi:hypothetical protein
MGWEEGLATAYQAYRAEVRKLGYTPVRPSYEGSTLHVGRDGMHTIIPDPETMEPVEREAFIELLKRRAELSSN